MTKCFSYDEARQLHLDLQINDYDASNEDEKLVRSVDAPISTTKRTGKFNYDGQVEVTFAWQECTRAEYRGDCAPADCVSADGACDDYHKRREG